MRQKRTIQHSIFEHYAAHEIGRELQAMSALLDQHPEWLDWVGADLRRGPVRATGRQGLTTESVLRCAILKQYRQLSYDELAFCLLDSLSCQCFARLTSGWMPKKATLQRVISAISDRTWERINQHLLQRALQTKVEPGKMLRVDSTVTATPIHEPSDSTLLYDAVVVILRLLRQAREWDPELSYVNHQRLAKRRVRAIQYTRGKARRTRLYRDLLAVVDKLLSYLGQAQRGLLGRSCAVGWLGEAAHYRGLIERIVDQTERRVIQGIKVPASDKLVSLFEPQTDIIVKGGRDIQYGHKLNLSTGRSGLILDLVIESGNPADSERLLPMLDRHIAQYGKPPKQMAADGGYASMQNLREAKARQVNDVVFHKKRGLRIEDMAKSPWVYRKLRNFRAGIEAGISCLKRAYGLGRCTWKGLDHFKAYVWSSVVAHNLALFARLKPT